MKVDSGTSVPLLIILVQFWSGGGRSSQQNIID